MPGIGTPSLDQLQVFLTVVETGSFAAAALDERYLADMVGLMPASFMRLRTVSSHSPGLTA